MNFISASYDVQVSDFYVVLNFQPLHPDDQIKVSNLNVVIDPAFIRVDNA
jgi:hypothetical protein